MKPNLRLFALVIVMIAPVLCGLIMVRADDQAPARPAGDWPMFGGTPQRNMVNLTMKNPPTEWSVEEGKRKNVKWVADLGSISYGGPVVAGGKVYVGTNNRNPRNPQITGDKGILMCFDEKTGRFLWQAVHDKLPNTDENDWPEQGIASTPAVDGNRVYYVSNRCELVCADTEAFLDGKNDGIQDEKYKGPTDADIIWRLDMMKELGVFPCFLANCSPLVVGDLVFVVTSNGIDSMHKVLAPQAPSFIAVDKKTGELKWKSNLPGDRIMEGQWANPAYAEVGGKGQVIFPGGDGWLYSFEAVTGKLVWKFDCNPKKSVYKPGGGGDRNYLVATPVVYDNKVYIGVGQNPEFLTGEGHFWCIDITKTGDVSPVNDNFDPQAPANKNSALVWHYGGSIRPKPPRGRSYHFGRTISTAAVHDGLVYVTDGDGFLYCFDARTGQKYWEHDFLAGVWSSPCWIDGKVYIGTDDGTVYIFAAGKQKNLIHKIDMGEMVKSPVVAANGTLYVMTSKQLFAIAGK
ncbi:MAG TPA: PQQ-binding-like beta-propeller repeat protein [Gemmataceae bacterium]|nr:PQQ-binding-like beta-propeller repeat protein [Gemmataceae bacterium]